MIIKSFEEVKKIVSEHPEASGVGYVVTPQLLKIAVKLGLIGYAPALERWLQTDVLNEKVYEKYPPEGEGEGDSIRFAVQWEGSGLRAFNGDMLVIGLKRLIEDIELVLAPLPEEPPVTH